MELEMAQWLKSVTILHDYILSNSTPLIFDEEVTYVRRGDHLRFTCNKDFPFILDPETLGRLIWRGAFY